MYSFSVSSLNPVNSITKNFGEIEGHVGRLPNGQRLPIVHTVTNVDSSTGKPTVAPHTDGNYYWHTDKSYHDVPSLMTMLHAIDIPPEGGDTLFCNMHMAYESLPKEKQKFFSNLTAVHSWEASRRNTGNIPATNLLFSDTIPEGTTFVDNSFTLNGTAILGANPNALKAVLQDDRRFPNPPNDPGYIPVT